MSLYNLVRVATSTTGTSNVVEGAAVTGFLTFELAGVPDGATVSYGIQDLDANKNVTQSEVGTGTWTLSTKTLARTTVLDSTNGGSKISLSGAGGAEIYITALAEDIVFISMLGGHGLSQTIPATTTYYCAPFVSGLQTANTSSYVTRAGTLKNLYLRTESSQPSSGSLVVTVQVASVDSSVVATVPGSGGAAGYSDLTHSVAVAAGQRVGFKIANGAPGTSAQVGTITVEYDVPEP